jgi:uncharacterized phage protein gp47/JayE
MSFKREFEDILAEILADIRNQDPNADVSQGSVHFVQACRLASATWGLYRYQDYIAQQIFPDTASDQMTDRHAYCLGLTRAAGETTAALQARILSKLRQPPAGGNKVDYETWAAEVEGVDYAHCIPTPQGAGTVDLVVLASGADEVPGQPLLDAVYAYIDLKRPVTAGTFRVLAPQVVTQEITMAIVGSVVPATLQAQIEAYVSALQPGDDLYISKLINLAIEAGASDASVTVPAANVSATDYQVIRAGTITINV